MNDQLTDGNGRTLRIVAEQIGKSQTFTVKVFASGPQGEDHLAYANQAKIADPPVRLKIIEELCDQFQIDATSLETCLLDQLADADGDSNGCDLIADKAEHTLLVNPSGHFDSSVAAIAVPRQSGSSVKWDLCIQHRGGLREIIPISSSNISLEDGSRILVDPLPDGDGKADGLAWPAERRAAWLEGSSPPDPYGLVAELAQEFAQYVRFPGDDETHEAWCLTLAVFALFTYVYHASPTSPYVRFLGPTGSAKTRALELLYQVAFRPVISCSMSPATLFRLIDQYGGLVLIDEAEHLANSRNGASGILPILLSGYKDNGRLHRTIGNKSCSFRTYCPKAFAAIGESHPTLVNRSITVPMFRHNAPIADRLLDESSQTWSRIRNGFQELALSHGCQWHTLFRTKHDWGITGRNREVWGPLLRLSSWLDGHGGTGDLENRLLAHAKQVIADTREDLIPFIDQTLLRTLTNCLRALTDSNGEIALADCPRPSDILRFAKAEDPATFSHTSPHCVATVLKNYGLRTHQGNRHVYKPDCLSQLQKVERAYGIDLGFGQTGEETDDNPTGE
jgi:hypothetical protein